ncbi:Ig-like domain-containing protein [Archangium lansingense]|uniref:Ig-like domain-containing protein n=1 Tax=Archangium lansingense TaxID=2995310 RepID=A0ABT4A2F2_9BACT|nr:Ig-like domain-containing protein [Archangium lansinium]MCY1075824.1 Ig-like domain-containing protein [Archangium lansinium]
MRPFSISMQSLAVSILCLWLSGGCDELQRSSSQQERPGSPARALEAPFDVHAVVRQVRYAYREEGHGWRGGYQTYDVRVRADVGLELSPYHWPAPSQLDADRGEPGSRLEGSALKLGPATFSRGGRAMKSRQPVVAQRPDGTLELRTQAATEHLVNREAGVEQSWSFSTLPEGNGELSIEVPVAGLEYVGTTESGLHFADPISGVGVRYGHGTWIDADGVTTSVPARLERGRILLRVPESTLKASRFPAVLDPVISPEIGMDNPVSGPAFESQDFQTVASNGTGYLVVWGEYRHESTTDIYGARVGANGVVQDAAGLVIARGTYDRDSIDVTSNGTDYLVVWREIRGGGSIGDIYGTRVTSAGVVLDPNHIAICTASGSQGEPTVASNGTGYLVVWVDGSTGEGNISGARVTSAGIVQDSNGIALSTAPGNQWFTEVASNGSDYLVVWRDDRGSSPDIYGTRVTSAGVVQDPAGLMISSALNFQDLPSVASNGSGYLVVWHDQRNLIYSSDIYGARVTSAGVVQDPAGIEISTRSNSSQAAPTVASIGSEYLVAWHDSRNSSTDTDIYAARVSSAGTVLDPSGIAISNAPEKQLMPRLATNGTAYLVVWREFRSGNGVDVYGARIAANGSVQDPSGIPISTAANTQKTPALASNGTDYLVVWQDYRNSNQIDLYGTRVNASGTVLDVSGLALSTAIKSQLSPAVASNGTDYLVVWGDTRNGTAGDVYGTRVTSGGAVLDPSGLALSTAASGEGSPAVASNGTDYLVAWMDSRNGTSNFDIFGTRVTPSGEVQEPSGLAITTATGNQQYPAVASNGTDYLVTWMDLRTSWDIYGARIFASGVVRDSPAFAISTASRSQQYPSVASNGTDYFVAWQDDRTGLSGTTWDIYGTAVSSAGAVQSPTGLAISTASNYQHYPSVASNGTDYFVAWQDFRSASVWAIYGARATSAGSLPDGTGFEIASGTYNTEAPQVASTGANRYLIAYQGFHESSTTNAFRIRARFVTYTTSGQPRASDGTATTSEDTPVTVTLAATDPESQPLTYSVVGTSQSGQVSLSGKVATFTPAPDFSGTASFRFKAHDGENSSNVAKVTITVTPVNDAPTANNQAVTTAEETPVTVTLTGSDPDGDALTFTVTRSPASGTLSGTAPDLTYTPNTNFLGSDSFEFVANDGNGAVSAAATISITVTDVNDPPTANAQSVLLPEDGAAVIGLTGSDPEGNLLTFTLVTQPANGTLSGSPPNVTYTPNANFHGADAFTFVASDGTLTSAPATVSISVTPVNDPPQATAQPVSTAEDSATAITLTGTDIDGDPLTFTVSSSPANGSVTGAPPNLTYTPKANFHGTDSFTFVANDGAQVSTPATVSITVNPVNDAPAANASSLTASEDTGTAIVLTGFDVDGDSLTFTVSTQPTNGTLSGTPPNLTYTPDADFHGSDSFAFVARDTALSSMPATVSVTVTPVNDAPVANAQSVQVEERSSVVITLTGTDVDGDTLTFIVVSQPTDGTLTGTPPELSYQPPAGFRGATEFTFKASDGALESSVATVRITVNNAPPAVTAAASSLSPLEGQQVDFSATAADPDGDVLTLWWDFGDGTHSDQQNPVHTFADEGTYEVTVTVSDGTRSTTAALEVTVRNAAPNVVPAEGTATGEEGTEVVLEAAISDPGVGDALTVVWDFGDGSPVVTGERVTHTYSDDGTYQVTVTATDDSGASTTGTRQVVIANVPPIPRQMATIRVTAGELATAALDATDRAGTADPLTWSLLEGPGQVSPAGAYSWQTQSSDSGSFVVRARVSDGEGGTADSVFTVEVVGPAAGSCNCASADGASSIAYGLITLLASARLRRRRATSAVR